MTPRLLVVVVALAAWSVPAEALEVYSCDLVQPADHPMACSSSRSRPMCDTYMDSALFPMRVHYDEGEEDMAAEILTHADLSWMLEVEEWGWDPMGSDEGEGGSDALDIYIAETGAAAGYAAYEEQIVDGDHYRCTGYIAIGRDIAPDYIPTTMSHELNHILQRWTDCVEDSQLAEATSVFVQDWYDESEGEGWYNTVYFQEGYFRSLDYYETLEPAQYGSFIFLQYLAERMGDGTPTTALELWQGAVQPDWENSNTWMDALEVWLEAHWDGAPPAGDELYTELAWQEFGEWRYFLGDNDDGEHFQHGYHGATGLGLELPNITSANFSLLLEGPLERELRHEMAETSAGTVPIQYPQVGSQVTVDFSADSGEDRWALSLISLHAGGYVLERALGAVGQGEATVTAVVPDDTLHMIAVVANVGDGVLDPNEDDWDGTGGVLIFSTDAQAEPGDDDDDSAGGDEGGCECSAASTPSLPGWLAWAALAAAVVARRR